MRHSLFICACLVSVLANSAQANPIPVPAGLNPGDQYQLVFVSSTGRSGNSSNIADYNTFVQSAANAAGIGSSEGVSWFAIGSTPTVNARENALVTAPVYNMNLELVATGFTDMWDGDLRSNIYFNEMMAPSPSNVWTGSNWQGFRFGSECLGGSNYYAGRGTLAMSGISTQADTTWIGFFSSNQNNEYHLYGLSSPLTVPPLAGDYNGNGTVDAADYVVWRKGLGTQDEYAVWRTNFGSTHSGSGSAANTTDALAAVPEPVSARLVALAVLSLAPALFLFRKPRKNALRRR